MKKGRVSLILSLLAGVEYLYYWFMRHPAAIVPRTYSFLGETVELPHLQMEPHVIMVILAVAVNLFAAIACTSSLAMGAAVFYGISIGFLPDAYPFVTVQFLLCLAAALRAGGKGTAGSGTDPSEPKRSVFPGSLYVLDDRSELKDIRKQEAAAAKSLNRDSVRVSNTPVVKSLNGKPVKQDAARPRSSGVFLLVIALSITFILLAVVFTSTTRWVRSSSGSRKQEVRLGIGPNLEGDWATDGSGTTGVEAQIEGSTVTVYWLNKDGGKHLYWVGSYEAPTSFDEPYTWMSMASREKMKDAPFASSESSKMFTYQNGTISFRAAIIGSWEMTYRLHRADS